MKNKVSIVFFGTPGFAAEILEFLIDAGALVAAVVTQPDRPKGRSLQMSESAVKRVAKERIPHIPILQPEKCSNPDFLAEIASFGAQLYVVVAFGQILPQKLLAIPPMGCINIHASLLPKYRGAAPIQRCLMNGDAESGVAIQKMVKELDAGDVIAEARLQVPLDMTYGALESALCALSKNLLLDVLRLYAEGDVVGVAQDVARVTYAAKISPEEGQIGWEKGAFELHNLIRAFNPRPGAWSYVEVGGEKKRLKIFRSKVVGGRGEPGSVVGGKELIVACGEGALLLEEVQPEGKPRMAAADWLRGAKTPIKFLFPLL